MTVDYATLTNGLGQLPEVDGTTVAPETVRHIACDAGIIPVVLGSDSELLDIGRRSRTIPAAVAAAPHHLRHDPTPTQEPIPRLEHVSLIPNVNRSAGGRAPRRATTRYIPSA